MHNLYGNSRLRHISLSHAYYFFRYVGCKEVTSAICQSIDNAFCAVLSCCSFDSNTWWRNRPPWNECYFVHSNSKNHLSRSTTICISVPSTFTSTSFSFRNYGIFFSHHTKTIYDNDTPANSTIQMRSNTRRHLQTDTKHVSG